MGTYTRRQALKLFSLGAAGFLLGTNQAVGSILKTEDFSTTASSNIPVDAFQTIKSLESKGIKIVAFAPKNGWLVITKNGEYKSKNIPKPCETKVAELIKAGHSIRCVSFAPQGENAWVIITDKTHVAVNIDRVCAKKLQEFQHKGYRVRQVVFQPRRENNRWLILADEEVASNKIPDGCLQAIQNLRQKHDGKNSAREVTHVALTRTGGWVVLAEDFFAFKQIPIACIKQLKKYQQEKRKTDIVEFAEGTGGWSLISNSRFEKFPVDKIHKVESSVVGGGLKKRMERSKVPGVNIAVIINNEIAWSCGYGELKRGGVRATKANSLFQAGTLSQVVATIAALTLVEKNLIGLDDDIRPLLTWKVPVKEGVYFTEGPTLRHILGHRSGFGIKGLKGYVQGKQLPSLDDILNGEGKASNEKIQIEYSPNGKFEYSCGGFVVLDKLIESLTGEPARKWLNKNVLQRLGMKNSTFDLMLPAAVKRSGNAAIGHDPRGTAIYGGQSRYPEALASGLFTTAADLARIIALINSGGFLDRKGMLRGDLVRQILKPVSERWTSRGMGVIISKPTEAAASAPHFQYSFPGASMGFRSQILGFPNQRAGVVVMSNGIGTDGAKLCYDIAQAVATTYGWVKKK